MKARVIWGTLLIALGLVFLLDTFGIIQAGWEFMWPAFLLVPGILFHIGYIMGGKKSAGLLVPGGIFLVLSLIFFYHNLTGWETADNTWPFYLFAVAFGLFELFLFGGREWGLLIPITILTGIGLMFYLEQVISWDIVLPLILIVIGLSVLFGKKDKHHPDEGGNNPDDHDIKVG